MTPTPAVYARRPACKWHVYDCHRPVQAGDTLCAYHLPMALAKNRQRWDGHYTADVADPGCDCERCLATLAV